MEESEIIEQIIHLAQQLKAKQQAKKPRMLQPEPVSEGPRQVFRLGQNASIPHMPRPEPIITPVEQSLDYDVAQRERAQRVAQEAAPDPAGFKPVQRSIGYKEGTLEHTVLKLVLKKPGQTTQEIQGKLYRDGGAATIYRVLRDLKDADLVSNGHTKRPLTWFAK